jgi:hypothetical protein
LEVPFEGGQDSILGCSSITEETIKEEMKKLKVETNFKMLDFMFSQLWLRRVLSSGKDNMFRNWLESCATSRKMAVSNPDMLIGFFFNFFNPSSRTVALGFTQPLTEMSTRNLPGGNCRQVRKTYNLSAVCEPTV